ncbi:MAG: glycosyltransferase family 9 protein [Elusimicrobiota bacterium]
MSDPGKIERFGRQALDRAMEILCLPRPKISAEKIRETLGRPGARALLIFEKSRLGDVLAATPVLSSLKSVFPDLRLSAVAKGYNAPALDHHPLLEDVLVFPDAGLKKPRELLKFWRDLRREWDAALIMGVGGASLTSALIARLCGARLVIGSDTKPFGRPYSEIFYHWDFPAATPEGNCVDANLQVIKSLGIQTASRRLCAGFSDAGKFEADDLVRRANLRRPFVAIHPGGAAHLSSRIAPPELFAALAKSLAQDGFSIALIRGPGEEGAVLRVKTLAGLDVPEAALSLDGLKAFLSSARLLISNDGGTMHIGAAVGARVLAFFSATDPEIWSSEGIRPVDLRGRRWQDCLEEALSVARQNAG